MRITLLGTGSADGWPNPFCRCPSCETERDDGRARTPSSALIDDAILIDCGPTTPHLAGGSAPLDRLEHLLLTHGHPDHLHPAVLLTRHWSDPRHVLHVWGPARAIDLCRDWVAPGAPVAFHPLTPHERVTLPTTSGAYELLAVPARHAHGDGDELAEEALLYVVADPDGHRLLYATDTGPFSATDIGLPGPAVDVVVIDETFGDQLTHGTGHLDLSTLPAVLDDLRASGVVGDRTRIVATHLSHHNPPTRYLRPRLAELGVEVLDDGGTVDSGQAARWGHRHLILGGARSGKSAYAEHLASTAPTVTYVATGGERPGDAEWAERVRRHRERRPAGWTTLETPDVAAPLAAASPGAVVIVDCLSLWLTSVLDDLNAWERLDDGERAAVESEARHRIADLRAAVTSSRGDVLLVSNEVGMGIVPMTPSGRLFQDLLGVLNGELAQAVEDVTLMVAGRPLRLPATSHDVGSRPRRSTHD